MTQTPVVRLAGPDDLSALYAVDPMAQTEAQRQARIVRAIDCGQVWVLEANGKVVGYALMARSFFERVFVELVVVDVEHRGRGFGPMLMRHLESVCGSEGLFTSTNESNRHMQHVLEKLGYRRSGIIHNLDPGDPEIVYFRRLNQGGGR